MFYPRSWISVTIVIAGFVWMNGAGAGEPSREEITRKTRVVSVPFIAN
jgi:hypothetical protein